MGGVFKKTPPTHPIKQRRYSHERDPQFGWLAETYTHEDASPQLNMPYDRPKELLEVGFDSYYGQYHIYNDWTKADQLYDIFFNVIKYFINNGCLMYPVTVFTVPYIFICYPFTAC